MASFKDQYRLAKDHPAVARYGYDKTSNWDGDYNCFAYVAGVTDVMWCPYPHPVPGYTWPVTGDHLDETDINCYIEGYATLGYEKCGDGEDGRLEPGVEKIAIYLDDKGIPTHAAIQRENGSWQSKLGFKIDIKHDLRALETSDLGTSTYGHVRVFLKRSRGK